MKFLAIIFSLFALMLFYQNCGGAFNSENGSFSSKIQNELLDSNVRVPQNKELLNEYSESDLVNDNVDEKNEDSNKPDGIDGSDETNQDNSTSTPKNQENVSVISYGCIDDTKTYNHVNGNLQGRNSIGSQSIKLLNQTILDLRGSQFFVHDKKDDKIIKGEPYIDSKYGLMRVKQGDNICVLGGQFFNPNPWDTSWEEAYDTLGLGKGFRLGTNRNNSIIEIEGKNPVISGSHWVNIHDGPRFNGATGFWRLEHSWGEYTRDDCLENDKIESGIIYDSLFDGCFSGYSNRASSTDSQSNGKDNTVEFNKVLLRMELMPGPHKQCDKSHYYFGVDKTPFKASKHGDCDINKNIYGTGNLFKLDDIDRNPSFSFVDSVFLIPVKQLKDGLSDFPNEKNIIRCENVTVIYLGEGDYPGYLPSKKFPNCIKILKGDEGRAYWAKIVKDWHIRHPNVGKTRKPTNPGALNFPRSDLKY